VQKHRAHATICREHKVRIAAAHAEQTQQQNDERQEFQEIVEAFETAFPLADQQSAVIGGICRDLPFAFTPEVKRIYAINSWWSEKQNVVAREQSYQLAVAV